MVSVPRGQRRNRARAMGVQSCRREHGTGEPRQPSLLSGHQSSRTTTSILQITFAPPERVTEQQPAASDTRTVWSANVTKRHEQMLNMVSERSIVKFVWVHLQLSSLSPSTIPGAIRPSRFRKRPNGLLRSPQPAGEFTLPLTIALGDSTTPAHLKGQRCGSS
jgi:hypothetical protein